MPRIFICYRREDSAGHAGRLFDRLKSHFGPSSLFMDVTAIEGGTDFIEAIEEAVDSADLLLAVIGRSWLSCTDRSGRRRLDDPNDFIRLELATALRRRVRIIPVLVEGAEMPGADALPDDLKRLTRRQAVELRDTRWDVDVDDLVALIQRVPSSLNAAPAGSRSAPAAAHGVEGSGPARPAWRTPWVAAVLLMILAGIGVAVWRPWSAGDTVTVPPVVGMTVQDATSRLVEHRLRVGGHRGRRAEAPAGQVLAQEPAGGTRVPVDSIVVLELSVPTRRVPSVVGLTLEEARKVLSTGGWGLGSVSTERSTAAPPGRIVRQDPPADTATSGNEPGPPQTVSLVVAATATEREPVTTPDVTGMPLEAATARMREAGLEVAHREPEAVSGRPAGEVIAQRPEPGRKVPRGTIATLRYSATAPPQPSAPMPSLVGMQVGRAVEVARSVGLVVERQEPRVVVGVGPDEVIDQLPRAGQPVVRGARVTLFYAQPVPRVPAVEGWRLNDAQAELARVNLSAKASYEETLDREPGVVLRQRPAGGTPVTDPSPIVELVVSRSPPVARPLMIVFVVEADRQVADDLIVYLRSKFKGIADYRVDRTRRPPRGTLYYSSDKLKRLAQSVAAATVEHVTARTGNTLKLDLELRPMDGPQLTLYLPASASVAPPAAGWRPGGGGSITVRPGMSVDLDRAAIDDSEAADVSLGRSLVPRGNASLAMQLDNSVEGCLRARFGLRSVDVDPPPRMAVCVRTNSGALAIVNIEKVDNGVKLWIKRHVHDR